MGQDKALMLHPLGGTWLTHAVDLLLHFRLPVTVSTRHPSHAPQLLLRPCVDIALEPPPGQGPLRAFSRVLPREDGWAVLVAPVDMPNLRVTTLATLIAAWRQQPAMAAVAHDGQRLQPLLGVYPSGPIQHLLLNEELGQGRSCWQRWLQRLAHRPVSLPGNQLLNANRSGDLAALQR